MTSVLLAVNGTLMRGFELNGNLIAVNSRFVKEAQTAPCYRLWSINDKHPAMQKVAIGGKAIDLEIADWRFSSYSETGTSWALHRKD